MASRDESDSRAANWEATRKALYEADHEDSITLGSHHALLAIAGALVELVHIEREILEAILVRPR